MNKTEDEIKFLEAMVKDLDNHIKIIERRIIKLHKEKEKNE